MLEIYIDSAIGSNVNGNGTKENPYNTLQYFLTSVAQKDGIDCNIYLKGTHEITNTETFGRFSNCKIKIKGEGTTTEIIQKVGFNTGQISNLQGGSNSFELTIAKCKYNIAVTLINPNLNCYNWKWNFYNVLFEYAPNNDYSVLLPLSTKTIFRNCVKLTNTSSFLRASNASFIDVYDSIGYFTNGYGTTTSYWDKGGNVIGSTSNYMSFLKTGMYPWISNKTLILHNGEYKKWDSTNGWTTVSSTLPTSTQFISSGMDSISPLLDRVNGASPLDSLSGNLEILTWTDEVNSTRKLEMTVIPSPQFLYKNNLHNLKGKLSSIITNDLSTYSTSSNVRFLLTNNNSTWYKWNGTNFENFTYSKVDDILTLGNTYTELTNADYSKWSHSNVNVGVFLMDNDTTISKISELGFKVNSSIGTSQVSDLNFYILNTTAKIELDLKGLWLSGQLSDLDLTRVQYRVFLNEQPYFPLSGQFTNLDNPPLNIDITFKSEEIKINDWNTLRVEFKDSFGTVDYWQTTFVGNYSSLMFTDTDGNYYSDDVGKVLQYLDFGTFFGGQYSVEHEVIIKNQYGYDVENVMIEASTGHLPEGVEVQFSDTNNPFIPQTDLLLPNELKHEGEVSFYIRMISDIDSVPNGENKFNIFVKAERKV